MAKNKNGKELGKGISQRKDGRYSARFVTQGGKRVEKYFHSLHEARNWLLQAKAQEVVNADSVSLPEDAVEEAEAPLSPATTVDDWFDFCQTTLWADLAPNTRRNRQERYDFNIKPLIGHLSLENVKPLHCISILNGMEKPYNKQGKVYAGSTIRQTYIVLGIMFRAAVDNGFLLRHPMDGISFKKPVRAVDDIRFLSVEEQKRFLAAADASHNSRQYRLLLETGLRTGELVGLTFGDIDFVNRTLTVNRSLEYRHSAGEWRAGPPKSMAGYRTIHLTQTAMDILTQLKEEQPYRKEAPELEQILPYKDKRANNIRYLHMKDLVFINFRTGMPTKNSAYDTHLYKLCEKAGIRPFCMHALRHTFATRCIEYGIRPKVLQQILGHSSLKTTMDRYVHNTEDAMADAVILFEEGCRENGVNFLKMA